MQIAVNNLLGCLTEKDSFELRIFHAKVHLCLRISLDFCAIITRISNWNFFNTANECELITELKNDSIDGFVIDIYMTCHRKRWIFGFT